ncbi:lipase 3 isoform X2 [Halyomorpha halys]|uniref:lipase 3 isoform X2 n=1 Tax=Halyomorpha halys TaxID=286706 RepID=UPI0006D4CE92|nr:lipase 3-like isoform X2 [Halyomorpha halys]
MINRIRETIKGIQNLSSRKYSSFDTVVALENSGFPYETHEVITEDGYILTLHRILRSNEADILANTPEENKIPVLLQHGLWSSSGDWIVTGTSHSLAFILSNNGYDVWLGNARGNLYSRKHKCFCPRKNGKDFWNFSWHEMGSMDLPAMIDLILNVTAKKQIYYVGHSLGTTMCFVLLSTKPEYNEKIRALFALAPIVYLNHLRSDVLQNLANVSDRLYDVLEMTGYHSFLPRSGIVSLVDSFLSRNTSTLINNAPLILSNLSGYASDSVKKNLKEVIIAHIAAGTSTKVLAHFAQCVRTEKTFRHFDFGVEKNLIVYGQKEPPNYELSNIRIPVVLFYSKADWLSTLEDVEELADALEHSNKDKLIRKKIELAHFNHLDFIWGSISKLNVFNDILNYMKTF